ncbi:hypothetical protein TorRG33x02_323050, partial [Trema orientale]
NQSHKGSSESNNPRNHGSTTKTQPQFLETVLRLSSSRWQTSCGCIVLWGVYMFNCSNSLSQAINQTPYEQNKILIIPNTTIKIKPQKDYKIPKSSSLLIIYQ